MPNASTPTSSDMKSTGHGFAQLDVEYISKLFKIVLTIIYLNWLEATVMDTSKQYINMCRKATELQNNHVWQDGDFVVVHDNVLTVLGDDTITSLSIDLYEYSVCGEVKKLTPLKHRVWLPRIDQLISNWTNPYDAIESMLHGWPVEYDETESLEINGIKRVMQFKYNKSWNGEDWTCTSNTTA